MLGSLPRYAALCALAGTLTVVACPAAPADDGGRGRGREGEEGEGEGEGEGENPGDGDCPVVEGGNSVCDVQDSASANPVGTGALVTLPGVVATSPVFGSSFENGVPTRFNLFVGDNPTAERGGVFVSWLATTGLPTDIAIGDVITVVGQTNEFTLADTGGTETRIDAQSITKDGGNSPLAPLTVTEADLRGATSEDYEGVLVRIEDVSVSAVDRFDFTLGGGVKVANAIFNYPAIAGETFNSITGVIRFNIFDGSGFEILPRQASDVDSSGRPSTSVTELNDGTVERCPGDGRFNECVHAVSGIITSPIQRVSDGDQERGPIFGFYVADPDNVDAGGRFGPKSGIFVLARPGNTREVLSLDGYSFDLTDRFWATGSPQIGDTVELTGDNAENFGQGALRNVTLLKKTGTATVPSPALFGAGGRDPSELKGGRPAFADGDFNTGFTPALEGVAASATIEDWENVLVELKDVSITTACYAQPFDSDRNNPGGSFARDFGNFLVTGDVEVGTQFFVPQAFGGFYRNDAPNAVPTTSQTCENAATQKCQDSRASNSAFTSLVGIVNFSFDVHRVNPRSASDYGGATFVDPGTGNCPAN